MLICFSHNQHALRVYRYSMPYAARRPESQNEPLPPSHLESQPHPEDPAALQDSSDPMLVDTQEPHKPFQLPHQRQQPQQQHQPSSLPTFASEPPPSAPNLSFDDVFTLKYEKSITSGHEMLCKDFCLFTMDKRKVCDSAPLN
eukprot:jgi/Hompol1/2778/HPOL_000790-RA